MKRGKGNAIPRAFARNCIYIAAAWVCVLVTIRVNGANLALRIGCYTTWALSRSVGEVRYYII